MEYEEHIKPRTREVRLRDKKRVAVCGGSLGREQRSLVRGQLVDIGVPNIAEAADIWDFLTGFFKGEENDVTPFKDLGLAPVRKPILSIELFNEKEKKVFESENFNGNEDGFFSYEIRKKLRPGKYTFHVIFRGIDSYRQYTQDIAYMNLRDKSDITKSTIVGIGKMRVLSENYNEFITTSDIDQTYLATELGSKKGMLSTLFETPNEKFFLPGMPELYWTLRRDTEDTPLCFISASPHFFRRSLLSTFKHHGVETESLHLKYLAGTVKGVVDKVVASITRPDTILKEGIQPAVERVKKFFHSSYLSLFDQMSYKLTILLEDRIYQPSKAKEILLGDNTESDYFIFTLYQLILMGEIEGKKLEDYLYRLNFLGRDAVTRDQAKRIRSLAEENISIHGNRNPVRAVLINLTHIGPRDDRMKQSVLDSLPPGINLDRIKKFVWYQPTQGALGFSTILHSLGILSFDSVLDIMKGMIGKYHNGRVVDEEYLRNLSENLLVPESANQSRDLVTGILLQCLEEIRTGRPSLRNAPKILVIEDPVKKEEESEEEKSVSADETVVDNL